MRLVGLLIEIEGIYCSFPFSHICLFFGHALRIQGHIFVDTCDAITVVYLLVNFAAVGFVHSDILHGFIVEVGSLLQSSHQIRNGPMFGNEYLERLLQNTLASSLSDVRGKDLLL